MNIKEQIMKSKKPKRMKQFDLKDNEIINARHSATDYIKSLISLSYYVMSNKLTDEEKTEKFKKADETLNMNLSLIVFILSTLYKSPMHCEVIEHISGKKETKPTTFGASLEMLNESIKQFIEINKE